MCEYLATNSITIDLALPQAKMFRFLFLSLFRSLLPVALFSQIYNIYGNSPKANDRKKSAQMLNSIVTSINGESIRQIK